MNQEIAKMKNHFFVLITILLSSHVAFGQYGNTPNQHLCGTDVSPFSHQEQKFEEKYKKKEKSNTLAKGFYAKTGTVLYAPFKFKGEEDPPLVDMNKIDDFFLRNSYGEYIVTSTTAPIIELPFTRQEDIDDNSINFETKLYEMLLTAGYNHLDYTFIIQQTYRLAPFLTSSAGKGGGHEIEVNVANWGYFVHEIGHGLYRSIISGGGDGTLRHDNLWVAENNKIIGKGSSAQYGNIMAVMGSGYTRDFVLPQKIKLGWVKKEEYHYVSSSGTYRIYAFNQASKQLGRKYGIKVGKKINYREVGVQPSKYYFLSYRFNATRVLSEGAAFVVESDQKRGRTDLLDMHPGINANTGKNEGAKDALLSVGETYRDDRAGLTFKSLAKGGSDADAWIDIKLDIDDPSSVDEIGTISFANISDGQTFPENTDVTIKINASHPSKPIYKVVLERSDKTVPVFFLPSDFTAPFEFIVTDFKPGTHDLKAILYVGEDPLSSAKVDEALITINIGNGSTALTSDAGQDKTLTCTTTQVILGGSNTTSGATYAWTTSNGNITAGGNTKNATVDKASTYTLTVSKSGSTAVTDDVVVTEDKTPPTANAGADQTIDSGESTQLTTTGGATYAWSPTTGLSNANIANPTASPTADITYTVTVTGSNGCTDTDQVAITVNTSSPTLTADAGTNKTITCTTTQVTLGGSNTTNGATYEWATSNGNITSGGNTKNATVDKAGTYTLTVSKSGSTTVTDDVVVTEDKTPSTANAGADKTIDSGESTQLTATGGGTYSWSPTTGLSDANTANPTASPTTTTTYTVTVTGSNGCTNTDQVKVTVNGTADPCETIPIVNAGADVTIEKGSSTQLTATGGDTYTWLPTIGLNNATIANPEASPATTTTYTATVTDENGCTAIDEVTITVVEETFRISNNSFSPNGDNINDVWNIKELQDDTECEIVIYNRWGNKVFTSDRGYNVPWDGMYNGKPLPTGTYFYILKLGDGQIVKGNVNIIK